MRHKMSVCPALSELSLKVAIRAEGSGSVFCSLAASLLSALALGENETKFFGLVSV